MRPSCGSGPASSSLSTTRTSTNDGGSYVEDKDILDLAVLRKVLKSDIENLLWHQHTAFQDQMENMMSRQEDLMQTVMHASPSSDCSRSWQAAAFASSPRGKMKTLREEDETRKALAQATAVSYSPKVSADVPPLACRSLLSRRAKALVGSSHFESTFCCLILANTLFLGVEVEYTAQMRVEEPPLPFTVVSEFFILTFFAELVLRFVADPPLFFCSLDAGWNLFDMVLVFISLVDSVMVHMSRGKSETEDSAENMTFIRIVRVLRIVRVFRIFRLMRFFRSLRILVFSVINTLKSLFWTMCLLAMILFLFGVLFTQAVLQHTLAEPSGSGSVVMLQYFQTLLISILTLFKTITGGVTWEEVLEPLSELHWVYSMLFVLYVAFMSFAVLNVVTGVFCEAAIAEAQDEKDEAVANELDQKSKLIRKLQSIFQHLDEDSSGTITIDEFESNMDDESLKAYFASMDLNVDEAWSLFKLLDADGSHIIDMDKFVNGCLRLVGNAKSIDIAMLSYESKWMIDRFAAFTQTMDEQFSTLREELRGKRSSHKRERMASNKLQEISENMDRSSLADRPSALSPERPSAELGLMVRENGRSSVPETARAVIRNL